MEDDSRQTALKGEQTKRNTIYHTNSDTDDKANEHTDDYHNCAISTTTGRIRGIGHMSRRAAFGAKITVMFSAAVFAGVRHGIKPPIYMMGNHIEKIIEQQKSTGKVIERHMIA